MADSSTKDHLLTLKVMRLTRPSFALPTCGTDYLTEDSSLDSSVNNQSNFATSLLTETLVLPQSIENIYLGETFTCYICVHNDSGMIVKDVSLKVDLQTSSQRISLPNKYQDTLVELNTDESLGEVVTHEVKELGQHILVCAVTYSSAQGEKMYFRKFFKFPVTKPLDVRTKFYNAESDDVYLEAQIQNLSHLPMVMERVALEPSNLYTAVELNVSQTNNNDRLDYLSPNDTRQYLYCLHADRSQPTKAYRGVTQVGKIDMVWHTTMGERGRLQTSQLQRMVPGSGDLRLVVEEAPSTVKLGEVFNICCRLYNCVERTLDLKFNLDQSLQQGLTWCTSAADQSCGQIEAGVSVDLTLSLMAVNAGLQTISGIRITDSLLQRVYEYDEIAQTFVYS